MKTAAARSLKRDANFIGFLLLALFAGQLFISLLLSVAHVVGLLNLAAADYGLGAVGKLLFTMLQYTLYVGAPVLITALIARREETPFPTRRVPQGTYMLAIFGGMTVAVAGNILSSYIMTFFSSFGVPIPEMSIEYTPSVWNLVLNIVATAVFPALLEEMAMRGFVLGALRPYGDWFSIIVSAVLFGLIHGNVLQLPFALVLGLMLGWLTVRTGSIWPAVVLHFVNNATSVVLGWAEQFLGEQSPLDPFVFTVIVFIGTMLFCIFYLFRAPWKHDLLRPLYGRHPQLTTSDCVKTLLKSPALVIGVIAWLLILGFSMLPKA